MDQDYFAGYSDAVEEVKEAAMSFKGLPIDEKAVLKAAKWGTSALGLGVAAGTAGHIIGKRRGYMHGKAGKKAKRSAYAKHLHRHPILSQLYAPGATGYLSGRQLAAIERAGA